ncbi:hypothetical protein [Deinococcus roseus]|uniref:Homing endonuclease LAGLIDADG domain-containing protein n=1 Tax=Deinococcus roseus TaxID=392414 RepID=A0ABQ2D3Q4_9DEIO|nr:hypothetical protein [Deinococcus roseus]GGJ45007.1 hypothetical protein GCM10008938_34060 [Deinococcus roseus]
MNCRVSVGTEIDAYCAGLFDGEGWFEIARLKASKPKHGRYEFRYQPQARLQIREEVVVDFLVNHYGGSKSLCKARKEGHSDTYRWVITGVKLREFACRINPFLLAKKKQAQLIVEMLDLKHESGNKPISPEQYEVYTQIFSDLRELNRKGVGK